MKKLGFNLNKMLWFKYNHESDSIGIINFLDTSRDCFKAASRENNSVNIAK